MSPELRNETYSLIYGNMVAKEDIDLATMLERQLSKSLVLASRQFNSEAYGYYRCAMRLFWQENHFVFDAAAPWPAAVLGDYKTLRSKRFYKPAPLPGLTETAVHIEHIHSLRLMGTVPIIAIQMFVDDQFTQWSIIRKTSHIDRHGAYRPPRAKWEARPESVMREILMMRSMMVSACKGIGSRFTREIIV
jgi:hypothetical protein